MKKKIIAVLMMMSLLFAPASYAHSGRTDSSGGHHDYKNASGLGDYHYHHGYGPHLHPGGVCPYESRSTSSSSTATTVKPSGMQAEIADFGIILNGTTVNNVKLAYPVLSYNDITYVPMTYNCARTLGLETEWDGSKLTISALGINPGYTEDVSGTCTVGKNCDVKKVDFNVYTNGALLGDDSDYPFLNYKDITYLPLTTNVAETLNLSVQWSEITGITVTPK